MPLIEHQAKHGAIVPRFPTGKSYHISVKTVFYQNAYVLSQYMYHGNIPHPSSQTPQPNPACPCLGLAV